MPAKQAAQAPTWDDIESLLPEPQKRSSRFPLKSHKAPLAEKAHPGWDDIETLFPVPATTKGEQFISGFGAGVASLAKAPELAGKLAEKLGVAPGTIDRHLPFVKQLADFGRELEEGAAALEGPVPATDFWSVAARGAGSLVPFAGLSTLGGAAGAVGGRLLGGAGAVARGAGLGQTTAVLAGGAAMTAVPMYEDVLEETKDEAKAWTAALVGVGLGFSEAFGVGRILAKLDRGTAGTLRRSLRRVATESSEEALQEFGQTLGESITTQKLAGRDLDYLREFAQAGQGGAVGALLGGGLSGGLEAGGALRLPGAPQEAPGAQGELTEEDVFAEDVKAAIEQPPRIRGKTIGGPSAGGRSIAQVSEEAIGQPAKLIPKIDKGSAQPAAEEPGQPVQAVPVPDAAAGEPPKTAEPSNAEEAAKAILGGKDLPLEALTPEVIQKAVELRAQQLTPGATEPAPGAGQPATLEVVQERAGTTEAPGVSPEITEEEAREHAKRIRSATFRQPGWQTIEQRVMGVGLSREEVRALSREMDARELGGIQEADLPALRARAAGIIARGEPPISESEIQHARQQLELRRKPGEFQPRTRMSDAVGALRHLLEEHRTDEDLLGAVQQAERVLDQRGEAGVASTEIDATLEELVRVSKLRADIEIDESGGLAATSRRDEAQTAYTDATIRKAQAVLDVFDAARAASRAPSAVEAKPTLPVTAEAAPAQVAPTARPAPLTKAGEEAVEVAGVGQARAIVQQARERGETNTDVFDALLALYQAQPKLKARTSTSKELQAYSTPLPLAWVASELAGISPASAVYEPTAGNGALLIGASVNALANELDPKRAANLRALGFEPHEGDALEEPGPASSGAYDAVIANPPFGKVLEPDGTHRSWFAGPDDSGRYSYRTKEIDHAIVMRALRAMRDDGRAVLLLGGQKPFGDASQEARTKKYQALTQQRFWKALYDTYGVVDHFTIDGKLYDRQGAAWPIDVVVIRGRQPTPTETQRPFAAAPRILETWNEVRDLLSGQSMGAPAVEPGAGIGPGAAALPQERAPRAQGVPAPTGAPALEEPARPPDRGGAGPPGGARAAPPERVGAAPRPPAPGVAPVPTGGKPVGAVEPVVSGGPPGLAEAGAARVEPRGLQDPGAGPGLEAMADARAAGEARGLEKVNEFQASYRPASKATAIGTLVPANMQAAMDRSLATVATEIDAFVANKLGYTGAELQEYFAAEQIDALALAITNIDRGAGFILGDQTGVGKGRVVAAMLRYAKRIGKLPVFVTAKPGLYADMRRDLDDIGMSGFRQFITNTNLRGEQRIELPDGELIESLPKIQHAKALKEIQEAAAAGKMPASFDAIFTTYDQMNPAKGETTARNAFLAALAQNAVIVLDESHLAGGTAAGGFMMRGGEEIEKATRSQFFRDLVDKAHGVVYSSATYAKNPHVMSLYTRTDMGLAVEERSKLPELVEAGGVPLQQAIASMLVEAGQYVRREKSFEGIAMELDVASTSRGAADKATALLRGIFEFDLGMKVAREQFLKATGRAGGGIGASDSATGEGGAKTGGFSSVMHNVIAQMLLALKAREVGRKAVAMHRSGKKPIVALSNTMERVLVDSIGENAEIGDLLSDFTFAKVFDRYLERTREVVVRETDGGSSRHRIGDDEMGSMLGAFEALKSEIAQANLGDMPASPIDAIIFELEQGGLRVGEITGRTYRAEYAPDGSATLAKREGSDAAKKKAMRAFNNGELDALIINQAGSTGYSLHASPKNGRDTKPRHMFVVQADPNIDVFMQMLGRINRTGQTALPSYTVLVSDLPSEKRPAAILMRKMASLNANTTASRTSAVSLKNVVDFMNVYGDEALADILRAEPEIAEQIGFDDEKITAELERENLARKATGYLPLLPIPEQERILEQIETNYTARLQEAKEQGENLLEAEVQELKAKRLSSKEISAGNSSSPFTRPAMLEQVEASRLAKPLTWADVQARALRMTGAAEGVALESASREAASRMERQVDAALQEAREKGQAAYKQAEQLASEHPNVDAHEDRMQAIKERFSRTAGMAEAIKDRLALLARRSVELETHDDSRRAYVVGIEAPKKGNVLAPSSWAVVVAQVDADHPVRIPISRLMAAGSRDEPGYIAIRPTRDTLDADDFAGEATERREKRWIVTGNLLTGFQKLGGQGRIGFYTDDAGRLNQGIILRRGVNPEKTLEAKPVKLTPEQALEFLETTGGFVQSEDGVFRIASRGRGFPFHLAAQTKGGKGYYLHQEARKALGKDFESRRGKKEYDLFTEDREAVRRALGIYARDLGLVLQATQDRETARKITGEAAPEAEVPREGAEPPTEAAAFPGTIAPDIKAALDAVARKLGYIRNQPLLVSGLIPTETWTERSIRKWQDSWRGIKTAQEAIAGGRPDDDIDAYLQEELRRGRTKTRLSDFDHKHNAPLLTHLRKGGISPEEFGEALTARHAPERNAVILGRDPKNQAGSGMTDDEAAKIMARIQDGKRADAFAEGFRRFDAMMRDVRAGWVRDGLKSQKDVDELEAQYQFYAPLRSDLSEEDERGSPFRGTGRGVDVRGREFRTATGRHTRASAREVLAYALTQAEQGIVRGEKNRVGQSFLNFLRAYGDEKGIEGFAKISPRQIKKAVVDGLVKTVYDPLFKQADNVLLVHENGEHVWIEINELYKNVADGLKNLGAEDVGKLIRLAGGITRYLAGINTRYNPVFPLFNAIRDASGAFINSQEHGLAFAARTVRDVPLALAALARQRTGKPTDGKWAQYADEYRRAGAAVAFLDLSSFEDQLRRIEKDTKARGQVGTIGQLHRGWRALLGAIETATDIGENAVRFSSYVHAREDLGMSAERAASWSKNLTTNFERRGDNGATVNALYMFANAGIQSTARVGQALKHKGVRRLLVAATIGLMGWDQLMRLLGGTADDGEDHWDKVPPWEKRHNFIFMYPDGSGRRVTIPAPFTYDLLQTIAFQLSSSIAGEAKPGAALGEALSAALETFDPIGSGQLDIGDPGSVARTVSPTVLDPLLELAINRDWKGDPIGPTDYGGDKPDSERFWPDVSGASRAATQWFNRASGGDEFKGGKIDLSPETLDHWASFLSGGLGRTLAQQFELSRKLGAGHDVEPRDIPIVSRLLREPSRFASTSEFHALQDAINVERDRAKRDKKLMPREFGALWKEGNALEQSRQRRRKAIEKLTGDARRAAERELDRSLQLWNARARKVFLTEG